MDLVIWGFRDWEILRFWDEGTMDLDIYGFGDLGICGSNNIGISAFRD